MKSLKFVHRWFSIVAAFFIIMFAISGIVMNHRNLFSPLEVNRDHLPPDYQYSNWNMGAVRSATYISPDSLLMYGNIGIWLTDSDFSFFKPFDEGFKKGIDNRKIYRIITTEAGNTYAASLSGLYHLRGTQWIPLDLPSGESLERGITLKGDTLGVLTRSHLILGDDNPGSPSFSAHIIPPPRGYKPRKALFRFMWIIHSGEILGLPGKILVDLMGIILIILCLSGLIWFLAPDLVKSLRRKPSVRKKITTLNRFSLKWHNLLGIGSFLILLIITTTGIFLRPPLLIAIANSEISFLASHNPWHDKLRDIQVDQLSGNFIFSTSEGFYQGSPLLTDSLERIPVQPPVSIMGINVLEQDAPGEYIAGSFSGIFRWIPSINHSHDIITGLKTEASTGLSNPFGSIPVAGYFKTLKGEEYLFDYNAGVLPFSNSFRLKEMPEVVKQNSPMSLWNLALEIHTGRFWSFIFGKWYILFIPLSGMIIMGILFSGLFLWIRAFKRKRRIRISKAY